MKPSVIVTGANGYIGSRLSGFLGKKGWRVTGVVRTPLEKPHPFACYVDPGTVAGLADVFKDVNATAVLHLAAQVTPQSDAVSSHRIFQSNIDFGFRVLEAMREAHCPRLVNAGSYWEFGEAGTRTPNSLYAASKAAFRGLADSYVQSVGFGMTHLILYDVYGEGDPRGKFISRLCGSVGADTPLQATPGDQKLFLVHVDDVVEAFTQAASALMDQSKGATHTYGVRPEHTITLKEVVATAEKALGKKIPVAWGARPYPPQQIFNPEPVPVLPKWKTEIDLFEGIRRLGANT
jgi:nucleoside-diphosphate-sugar epimerase